MSFAHLTYKARQAESRSCGNSWELMAEETGFGNSWLKSLVWFSLGGHLLWGRVADGPGQHSTVHAQGLVWHQAGSDGADLLVTLNSIPCTTTKRLCCKSLFHCLSTPALLHWGLHYVDTLEYYKIALHLTHGIEHNRLARVTPSDCCINVWDKGF